MYLAEPFHPAQVRQPLSSALEVVEHKYLKESSSKVPDYRLELFDLIIMVSTDQKSMSSRSMPFPHTILLQLNHYLRVLHSPSRIDDCQIYCT